MRLYINNHFLSIAKNGFYSNPFSLNNAAQYIVYIKMYYTQYNVCFKLQPLNIVTVFAVQNLIA